MEAKFEQFLKERRYLQNVSTRTLDWYRESFQWLVNPDPTQADLMEVVIRMREAGLKATSCNNRIRAINAYLRWAGKPEHVKKMKEPSRVLPTFTSADIKKFLGYKPQGYIETRLHVLVLLLLDTGVRISEALSLRWVDVDFDNMLISVIGKGDKQRVIPFSIELRKHLYKFRHKYALVFSTRTSNQLDQHDVWRDVRALCDQLRIVPPARILHSTRHTFATAYIRRGGDVLLLQQVLGHATLDQTRKYCHLQTSDLQAVHERISLLSERSKG